MGNAHEPRYKYRAQVIRVIDGDTVDMKIDVGFGITITKRIRLLGVDTPELRPRKGTKAQKEKEKVAAKAAKIFVMELFDEKCCYVHSKPSRFCYVATEKSDSFGRYLGKIYLSKNALLTVGKLLIRAGHAKPYKR